MSDALEAACGRIKAAADGALQWEWDARFGAALAAFEKAHEPAVLAVLDEAFGTIWSAAELDKGPDRVAQIADKLGGLRSGQMLLTTDATTEGPLLFCAWWPWGSGERISIRIGCVPADPVLRSWFGL